MMAAGIVNVWTCGWNHLDNPAWISLPFVFNNKLLFPEGEVNIVE